MKPKNNGTFFLMDAMDIYYTLEPFTSKVGNPSVQNNLREMQRVAREQILDVKVPVDPELS